MKAGRKNVVIGKGHVGYEIAPMDTTLALKLLARLSKTVLPSLGALFEGLTGPKGLDTEIDISMACKELSDRLDEEQVLQTVKDLLDPRYVSLKGGMPFEFDSQFSGALKDLFDLVKEVMEVNYGDFFVGLTEQLKLFKKKKPLTPAP